GGGPGDVTGCEETPRGARVRAVLPGAGDGLTGAGEGETVELVLAPPPFYAGGGGQQPDHGLIRTDTGVAEVLDVQQPIPGLIVHRARIVAGEVRPSGTGWAEIDVSRRRAISRAHTATHLV